MAWPPWVVVIQLFIGLGWMRAVAEKAISTDWWSGATIGDFLIEHNTMAVQWYQPFIDYVVGPNAIAVAVVVIAAQLFAALTLLSGRFVAAGLTVGMFLNLNFLSAGAVNPSAFYLLAQGAVGLWLVGRNLHWPAVKARVELAIAGGLGLAVSALTSIRTIAPADVIDDPAIMLVTTGILAALACDLTLRQHDKFARETIEARSQQIHSQL